MKEIIINKRYALMEIEEAKKDYKVGDLVKYNEYEWWVLHVRENVVDLMLKERLSKDKIKEYFENYDNDFDVEFSAENNNDWIDSNIRKGILKFLDKEFNKNELQLMITNYDQDKYSEDYMRIPTVREAEKMTEDMHNISDAYGYWTMSPMYTQNYSSGNASVFDVGGSSNPGTLDWFNVNTSYGVRPVISLKSNNPNIEKIQEVN